MTNQEIGTGREETDQEKRELWMERNQEDQERRVGESTVEANQAAIAKIKEVKTVIESIDHSPITYIS